MRDRSNANYGHGHGHGERSEAAHRFVLEPWPGGQRGTSPDRCSERSREWSDGRNPERQRPHRRASALATAMYPLV